MNHVHDYDYSKTNNFVQQNLKECLVCSTLTIYVLELVNIYIERDMCVCIWFEY